MQKIFDIKIGNMCNNNCLFCINDKSVEINKPSRLLVKELSLAQKDGFRDIIITGGEPTIRKDFFQLLNIAKKEGFQKIGIYTNARMFSNLKFVEKATKAGLNWCLVSLHSCYEKVHDKLSQVKGSFNQTVTGIRNIVSLNIEVVNNCTITKLNYKHLSETAAFLYKLGVKIQNYTFVDVIGNAWKNKHRTVPRYKEIEPELRKAIVYCKNNNINVSVENIPLCILKEYYTFARENGFNEIDWKLSDFGGNVVDFNIARLENKYKKKACSLCVYNNICEGIRRVYADLYGDAEFQSVIRNGTDKNE